MYAIILQYARCVNISIIMRFSLSCELTIIQELAGINFVLSKDTPRTPIYTTERCTRPVLNVDITTCVDPTLR